MKMSFTAFSVAALLATIAAAVPLESAGMSHSHTRLHVPIVLQPYNADGTLGDQVAYDLSPEDSKVDQIELATDAKIISVGAATTDKPGKAAAPAAPADPAAPAKPAAEKKKEGEAKSKDAKPKDATPKDPAEVKAKESNDSAKKEMEEKVKETQKELDKLRKRAEELEAEAVEAAKPVKKPPTEAELNPPKP